MVSEVCGVTWAESRQLEVYLGTAGPSVGTCHVVGALQSPQCSPPTWPQCRGTPQPVGLGEAGRHAVGCEHWGLGRSPSLVFGGLMRSWRERWVMLRAQDTLMREESRQSMPEM